ncbi:N-acetylglucosaminidase [Cytobacillus firmus]|uniref:N-acetylglucosaminidase n=1 Tax=Cytobacillus firmus TaxID=1399 RepID=UPI001C972303|nr:N-acetylglucosaminidase [Cytobacillus firmus]MBY6052143.1 SH3 domain-containing protein [Cytobacillus firmus]
MNICKKFGVSLLILVLPLQGFSSQIAAEEIGTPETQEVMDAVDEKSLVIGDRPGDAVDLWEENTEESKVLITIPDETEVTVLERGTEFTEIVYVIEGTNETWVGFVKNNSLVDQSEAEQFLKERTADSEESDPGTEESVLDSEESGSSSEESNLSTEEKEDAASAESTPSETESTILEDSEETAADSSLDEDLTAEEEQVADGLSTDMKEEEPVARTAAVASFQTLSSELLEGEALKSPTNVYAEPSETSKVLKSYAQGTVLKYYSYNSNWYQSKVYVNGQAVTCYIKKSDAGNPEQKQAELLEGQVLKSSINVYSEPTSSSQVLKTYTEGQTLKYYAYNADWYQSKVYVNGEAVTCYISVNDVGNPEETKGELLEGTALNSPTNVYSEPTKSAQVLKSYPEGTVLKYYAYNSDWYQSKVYVNGTAVTCYISADDLKNPEEEKGELLEGTALKNPTNVYAELSSASEVLKAYTQGTVLKYYVYNSDWYQSKVYVNGEAVICYISVNDVGNPEENKGELLEGIALKSPTAVYLEPSINSDVVKTYSEGSVLKYYSYNSGWYQSKAYINGEAKTIYINVADVGAINISDKVYEGVGLASPTNVYAKASGSAAVLKSYKQGSILKYRHYTAGWNTATVYVNGSPETGYIKVSDLEESTESPVKLTVWGAVSPVNVYSLASRSASVLKSYAIGSELKVQTFSSSWHKATVYVNGKAHTGYINVNDVRNEPSNIVTYTQYGLTLNEAVNKQLQLNPPPQTDLYRGANGFIHSSLANIEEKGATTSDGVRFRTSPSLDSGNVYGTYKEGTTFTILGTVKGTVVSGSATWYKISYSGKTLYVHSSLVKVTNVAVVASGSNIRESASTSSHIYGTASAGSEYVLIRTLTGTTVSGSNEWYEVQYNAEWRNAKTADFLKYLDPSQNDRFQHLLLDKSVGVSAAELNKVLSGKGILDNQGQAFIEAGKTHSVNEIYLISHALLETGHGTSPLANGIEVGKNSKGELVLVTSSNRSSLTEIKKTYNMFGIGAKDIDPDRLGAFYAYTAEWFSPEAAIIGGAQFISNSYFDRGQNTLYKMRWNHKYTDDRGWFPQYATDMGWAVKQVPSLKNLYEKLDNPILHFEIVEYN